MHIALAAQRVVHSECCRQTVACVASCCDAQIFAEQRTVVRMSAIIDYLVSALYWALSSEVSHTLLCHEDIDVVFCMVVV